MDRFSTAYLRFLATLTPYRTLWKDVAHRKRWVGALYQDRRLKRYQRIMKGALDWLDAKLSQGEIARGEGLAAQAWSAGLLRWNILLALGYPIGSAMLAWLWGGNITFGAVEVIAPSPLMPRIFVIFWFGITALVSVWVRSALTRRPELFWSIILGVLFLLVGQVLAAALDVPLVISAMFMLSLTFAFATSIQWQFIPAFVLACANSVAFGILVASMDPSSFVLVFAWMTGGAWAIAFIVTLSFERLSEYLPRYRNCLWFAYVASFISLWALSLGARPEPNDKIAATTAVITFIGIFPLFNALADFASVGLTRYLLRKGLAGHIWARAGLDTVAGVAIFFALGFAMIAFVHFVRFADGRALIDLPGLFAGLNAQPGNYVWLAFMLGTTVLPTLAHAMVGMLSVVLLYPKWLRELIAKRLNEGKTSDVIGWQGSMGVCALMTATIWLPIYLGYWLWTLDSFALLRAVIGVFEGFARAIGAI